MEEMKELVQGLANAVVNRLDDHDLLIEMKSGQLAMNIMLKEILAVNIADHERRIRYLEKAINYGLGALGVLTVLIQLWNKH